MNDKITQAFIDALTAMVPDGWRAVDYRHATMNDWYVPRMEKVAIEWVLRGHHSDGKYIIVERIPLTGQAWAVENFVTRPGSVFRFGGDVYSVVPLGTLMMRITRFSKCDSCSYHLGSNQWNYWQDLAELDGLSDATVEWLYMADERSVTDD